MTKTNNPPRNGNSETGKEQIERMERKVLKMALEKRFACDLIGTISDENGELFLYSIATPLMLQELESGALPYILVHRVESVDSVLRAYIREKLQKVQVLSEDKKEMICHNIERAGILG